MTGLLRGLVFAAVAALVAVPWCLVAGPILGRDGALGLFALGAAALHVAWLAPTPRRAFAAGGLVALLAAVVAIVAPGATGIILGAVLIGLGRSALLYRRRGARGLALEVVLLGGGLLAARLLMGPSVFDVALATWGFFLVQCLYPLVGGLRPRNDVLPGDPFERARRRALAVLEDRPDAA